MEALNKQKEDLLKENSENLDEFEEKLKSRFNRSLEIADELETWKKDVTGILRLYGNNKRQIKPAFQLLNSEKHKNLASTGVDFKEKIVSVMEHTQNCMDAYMANYKIEPIFSASTRAFAIQNPKIDLESMLFNIEVVPVDILSCLLYTSPSPRDS